MRHLTIGTLTTLLLTLGIAPATEAETMSSTREETLAQSRYSVRDTEAFDLVASAYRGEFQSEGIPSYYQLEQAYQAGEVNAERLVNSAIAAGELDPAAAQDDAYLNAVSLHLSGLSQDRGD